MSQEQFTTTPTETVFEELEQELRRLKSAVSHLSLSESAATQAITAAEQVVERQDQLSRQLSDYVDRLPQPPAADMATQVADLVQAVTAQQQLLRQAVEQLTASQAEPHNIQANEEQHQRALAKVEEHQGQLSQMLAKVEQQLTQGVAHHLSQELETLLQQTVQEVRETHQYGHTLGQLLQHTQAIREQQSKAFSQLETLAVGRQAQSRQLEELQGAVQTVGQQFTEQVAQQKKLPAEWQSQLLQLLQPLLKPQAPVAVTTSPDQRLYQKLDELQNLMKTTGRQLTEVTAQQRKLPVEYQDQLQQALAPLIKPKAPLPLAPDQELRRKVDELQQTVVAQQGLLKRQQMVGLVTLLAALAALAGLVVAFLRG
ncbi:hypothetical protein ACFPAF_04055 [Hymenobacter endophyticus]|uniref:Uncharacterized protein n=1 Tax=Hymenobacter endophyticus TaxID=3076335 RepID=A0ABU3TDV7_9BACT|nr:hypothetical protein [Hymenobacter endophyticus]MDU0369557.1 hypothetical protein [Hymenobacter endophyticus]